VDKLWRITFGTNAIYIPIVNTYSIAIRAEDGNYLPLEHLLLWQIDHFFSIR